MKSIKKVSLILLPVFLMLACVIYVSGLYAYSEDIEFGGEKTRGPVAFPHELHMDSSDCLDCHHDMKDGENVLDDTDLEEDNPDILCAACHNADSKIERREAFHMMCMGCHNKFRMTKEPTGPTLCGECHVLKK